MSTLATVAAAASVIFGGAFWPTLKVNFEPAFARRFLVLVLVVATLNCVVLARSFGWWTVLAYPFLMFAGAIAISPLTSGRHLKVIVFDGGIWVVGMACVALCLLAFVV